MAQEIFSGLSNEQAIAEAKRNPAAVFGDVDKLIEAFGQSRLERDLGGILSTFKQKEESLRARGIEPSSLPGWHERATAIGLLPKPTTAGLVRPGEGPKEVDPSKLYKDFGLSNSPSSIQGSVNPEEFRTILQDRARSVSTTLPGVPSRGNSNQFGVDDFGSFLDSFRKKLSGQQDNQQTDPSELARKQLADAQQTSGFSSAQSELSLAQQELRDFENTLLAEADKIKGEAIASTVIDKKLVKLDADHAEQYRAKRNAVAAAAERLQMANQTVSHLMQLTQQNYQNAKTERDTQFNQFLQLYSIFDKDQDELVTRARADSDVVLNAIGKNPSAFAKITPEMEAEWNTLELQAGRPRGFMKGIADVISGGAMAGFEYKGTIGGVDSGYSALWVNPSTGQTRVVNVLGSEPQKFDVTSLDVNSPDYIFNLMESTRGGKKPNQVETIRPLQKALTVVNQLSELSSLVKNTKTDPIIGTLRSMNPYDFDARAIQATLQATVPNLARGVYGEVGVLTDNDIRNYIKTLPNISSTEAQNKFVLGMTLRSLQRGFESQLEVLAAAGYDISGFKSVVTRMNQTAETIEETIGAGAPLSEDTIRKEYEALKSGVQIGDVDYFKPISDFFSGITKNLFR